MSHSTAAVLALVALVASAALVVAVTNTQPVSSPTLQTNSNVSVTLENAQQVQAGTPFPGDGTVAWTTESGNVTVSGPGPEPTYLNITQITGTETRVDAMNVSEAPVTIDPADKPAVTVEGDPDTLDFREMQLDDGQVDFSYSGDSGETTITVRGLAPDTTVAAQDGSGLLDQGRTALRGAVTFTLPNSAHDVELVTTTLNDPTISDPEPTGPQSTTPSSLAINVSDPDFPGDSVEVNVSLDGSQVHSETITQETRVTTSISSLAPGEHTWTVEAEDDEGNLETEVFTFSTPSNITVFNESAPTEVIDEETINVTVYSQGEQVFNRSTDDGTIPLQGLTATEDLVVEMEAANYTRRTAIVEDLAVQHRFYLLPTSVASVEVRFTISDPTGEFPSSDSQLFVKRALTVGGNTTFQTITADNFGAAGFVTNLEEDVRYRLVLKNRDNDVRVLGAYESVTAETVTLRPDTLELEFEESDGYTWEFRFDNETGNPTLEFEFADPANETENLQVNIYEHQNESNTLSGYPTTFPGPLGTVSVSEPLTAAQANTSWVVDWEADRNGNDIDATRRVGETPNLFTSLPAWVRLWSSVAMILMTGGLFSRANVAVGAVVTGLTVGIFWWIGWLGTAASGATVVLGLLIAVAFWASKRGGF